MNPVTLGLIAGAFTTLASLPQIVYVLRTRSVKDISLVTLCLFAFGVALWIVYGVLIRSTPVVFWNVLSLALYLVQIALKLAMSTRGSRLIRYVRGVPDLTPSATVRPALVERDRDSPRFLQ